MRHERRIKIIRWACGFSQMKLADVLGVSRSTISMAERGKRSLPTSVLISMAELEKKLTTFDVSRPLSDEDMTPFILSEIRECEFRISFYQRKLWRLQERHAKALAIQQFLADHTAPEHQMKTWEVDLSQTLKNTGALAQLRCQLQLVKWQAELEFLQEALRKLPEQSLVKAFNSTFYCSCFEGRFQQHTTKHKASITNRNAKGFVVPTNRSVGGERFTQLPTTGGAVCSIDGRLILS